MRWSHIMAALAVRQTALAQTTQSEDAALSAFNEAYSSQLAVLSSQEAVVSSVASALATFTPEPQSIYVDGSSSITITLPSQMATTSNTPATTSSQSESRSPSASESSTQATSMSNARTQTLSSSQSRSRTRPTIFSKPTQTRSRMSSMTSMTRPTFSRTRSTSTPSTSSTKSTSSSSSDSTSSRTSSRASITSSTTSSASSSSSTSSSSSSSSLMPFQSMAANGTVTPPSSPHKLSGGAIAGVSVAAVAAAAIGALAVSYLLRRRMQQAAAAREASKVYPESAYLYDPPRTPPAEMSQAAPLGVAGAGAVGAGAGAGAGAAGAAFVSRDFGYDGHRGADWPMGPGNGASVVGPTAGFHTPARDSPELGGSEPLRSFSPEMDETAGLMVGAAGAAGWRGRDQSRDSPKQLTPTTQSPNRLSPTNMSPSRPTRGYAQGDPALPASPLAQNPTQAGPSNRSSIYSGASPVIGAAFTQPYSRNNSPTRSHINRSNNAFNPYGPRTVDPISGSFAPVSSSRPIAYGLGVSTAQVAGQAALRRSSTIRDGEDAESDPSVAESPAAVSRAERTPLSPAGEGGEARNPRRVSYGGADTGHRVPRAWGW